MEMKIRTARHIIKESILNTYRNKLMSLASISIIVASLIIFGTFFILSVNLNHNMGILRDQTKIKVFCYPELNDEQLAGIENIIKKNGKISGYEKITKQQALDEYKESLGDDSSILEGMGNDFLPVAFSLRLKNSAESANIVKEFKKVPGVEKVRYSQKTIDFISKITYWVRLLSIFLTIILLLISIFIIANTIKLTVFARRKEINIMKYIGATDWFIRWPFLVEGVIIGFIGAVIAFILISYSYGTIEGKFNNDLFLLGVSFIKLIKLKDIGLQIFIIFSIIGMGVGTLGSLFSIRKYLHV